MRKLFIIVLTLMSLTVPSLVAPVKATPINTPESISFDGGAKHDLAQAQTIVVLNEDVHKKNQTEFTDLQKGESGYEETLELVDRGIITGYGDNSFKPFNNISRQHAAVMLYRALELDEPKNVTKSLAGISDVSTKHDYAKEIVAVMEANIFRGSNGKFNPTNNITRGQMATALVRAFELEDQHTSVNLVDLKKIDPSHRENVKILAQNNITVGKLNKKGERYFDADGHLNRVQFAIFLNRVLTLVESDEYQKNKELNKQIEIFENEVVRLTNEERKKHGLNTLKLDTELRIVAREKSRDMVTHKYFEHHSPTFGSLGEMMKTFGISYSLAGENLAMGYRTPEAVVAGWMDSPSHRTNILNAKFTHIGVGYADPDRLLTQLFIAKKK